jgi:hypothetical protein
VRQWAQRNRLKFRISCPYRQLLRKAPLSSLGWGSIPQNVPAIKMTVAPQPDRSQDERISIRTAHLNLLYQQTQVLTLRLAMADVSVNL